VRQLLFSVKAILPTKHNNKITFLWIFVLLGLMILLSSSFFSFRANAYSPSLGGVTIASTNTPSQLPPPLDVNLTYGQTLRILTPSSSNITILSLSGGQYDTGLYVSGAKDDLLFTPAQIANYSLVLNVSSAGANSAGLSELGTPTTAWVKNVTGTGNLILNLTVIVVPQPVAQSSGWNPLFGFTGISLGGVTLDTTDILAIFAIFSVSLMLIGIKHNQKLVYTGLFFLSLIGMIVVGILVVAIIFGSYLAGFVVIKSYFGFRSRRQNGL
jgi:hypothetical protein